MKKHVYRFAAVTGVVLLAVSGAQSANAVERPSVVAEDIATLDIPEGELSSADLVELQEVGLIPEVDDSPAVAEAKIDAFLETGKAAVTGVWTPVSSGWPTPSWWQCGGTANNGVIAGAGCVARSGNAVEPAMAVQNVKSWQLSNVSTYMVLYNALGTPVRAGGCGPAYFVGYGRAICTLAVGYNDAGVVKNFGSLRHGQTTLTTNSPWY